MKAIDVAKGDALTVEVGMRLVTFCAKLELANKASIESDSAAMDSSRILLSWS